MKIENVTPRQYHSRKFDASKLPDIAAAGPISASILSHSKNPLQFLFGRPIETTSSMEWGSLVDCMWTTPEEFNREYIITPSDAPKDLRRFATAKKPSQDTLDSIRWWDDFEAKSAGKISISSEMHSEAKSAISMLRQNDLAMEMWEASKKQLALFGTSPILPEASAKALLDLLPMSGRFETAVVDLKTTNDISEYGIQKAIFTYEYHMKIAYYGLLAEAAGLGHRPRGITIFQSSKFPYEVKVREISPDDMMIGRQMAINRTHRLKEMNRLDIKKHIDNELKIINLPEYIRKENKEEE